MGRDATSAQVAPPPRGRMRKAASAPSSLWKRHAWRVTAGTGIMCLTSGRSPSPCSWMMTASGIPASSMRVSCWGCKVEGGIGAGLAAPARPRSVGTNKPPGPVMWEGPVGFVRPEDNRIEKSGDRQVQPRLRACSRSFTPWAVHARHGGGPVRPHARSPRATPAPRARASGACRVGVACPSA